MKKNIRQQEVIGNAPRSILITGANAGVGYHCALQLSKMSNVERIVLGCRNETKAQDAKKELEIACNYSTKFEILIMDMVDFDSIKQGVSELSNSVDAAVLNAGGIGGPKTAHVIPEYGVTKIMAMNLVGPVLLLDELMKSKKVTNTILYSGSEFARGAVGDPKCTVPSGSVEDMVALLDGS